MPATRTSAASASTGAVNAQSKNVNKSKTTKNAPPASDPHIEPLPSPPADNSRPKRVAAKRPANANQTASQPVQQPTARKRQAGQKDPPRIVSNAPELDPEVEDQPPAKRLKTKSVKDAAAQANPSSGKKKGTPNGSLQVAKENVPPPTTTASKSKQKPTAAERHEQQVTETDNAALARRIKELEAENSKQRVVVERLKRRTKRLDKQATQHAASRAYGEVDQIIDEPDEPSYNLQEEMGLGKDYKTYARIQRTVRDLSRRVLDFDRPWKAQDAIVIGDLFRAAAEKEPFLSRFRQHWATSKFVQMYLRNTRSYNANIDNPTSGVGRRRIENTKVGARDAGLPSPDLSKKKKSTPRGSVKATSKQTANKSRASTSTASKTPNPSATTANPPNDVTNIRRSSIDDDDDEDEDADEAGDKDQSDDDVEGEREGEIEGEDKDDEDDEDGDEGDVGDYHGGEGDDVDDEAAFSDGCANE